MTYILYEPYEPQKKTRKLIRLVNDIIATYQAQGYTLTLRQLYYQLVARDLIPNRDKEYKRLGALITKARRGAMISWDAIEDRTRVLRGPTHWTSPESIARSAVHGFNRDKWDGMDYRVEVWVEKDALAGIVARTTGRLDVDYFSTRGYPSDPTVWSAARRFMGYARDGQETVVLHLSDHDPSGIDMGRDIEERLAMYMEDLAGWLTFRRIGLTMEQIEQYNPPPNPAKITDSRYEGYVAEYGPESWELDALEPSVLNDLIAEHVREFLEEDTWDRNVARQEAERGKLEGAYKALLDMGD